MESTWDLTAKIDSPPRISVRSLMQDLETREQRFDWVSVPFIVLMHAGAVAALFAATPARVLTALALYAVTGLGITVGFHRLLTHRSFEAPRWLECLLAVAGTLALQNGPVTWVAVHRQHHREPDTVLDPHNIEKGFWHAHLWWMLRRPSSALEQARNLRFAPELARSPFYRWLEKFPLVPTLALCALLFAAGGWPLVLWGFCVRVVFLYHCTWLVNSAAHKWGGRPFADSKGTNCWWVAFLSFGEGWHNNHHAFPSSARHGLKPSQFDISWLVISGLAKCGLARNLKLVPASKLPWSGAEKATLSAEAGAR